VSTTTANITALHVTGSFTAATKVYDGTDSATVLTRSPGAVISGDAVSLSDGTATFSDKKVGNGKTVTLNGASLSGGDAANYVLDSVATATANITPASLTITAVTSSKTYDANTSAAAAPTVSGLQGTDTVTGLSESYDNTTVGTGKTLSVNAGYTVNDDNSGNNYTDNTVADTTGVISQAPLIITAQTNTKTYDGSNSAAAMPSVSGLQGTDTVTGLSETYDSKNAGTGKMLSVVGYTVNDGNSGGNYSVLLVTNTTGIINKAALTVTASGVNKVYDATANATVNLSDNRVSGDVLATSYAGASFGNKNVGTNKPVSVSGISTSGLDSGNYTFNTTANTTVDITQRGLTVSATGINKVYDGTTNASVTLSTDRLTGDNVTP
ncbi:MAG: YDG domain-containing protein, partial [Chloroflexi bacterium]|nr:YDG domain-containing protein [Chloroflexota bacterium]